MNKYFYKFLQINNNDRIIKDYNNRNEYLHLIDRGTYIVALHSSVLAAAVSNKFHLNTIVISDANEGENLIDFYKSFGFKNFYTGFRYKLAIQKFFKSISAIFFTVQSLFLIKKKSLFWFANEFRVKDIKIGDLVYDTYIRYEHRFLNPKTDITFINILFKSIFRTLNILDCYKKYPAKYVIVGTQSYAYNDGISLKIGVQKGVKVLEPYFNSLSREYRLRMYNKKKIKYGYQNPFDKEFRDHVFYKKRTNIKKIDSFLRKRIQGKITPAYTSRRDLQFCNKNKKYFKRKIFLHKLKINDKDLKKIVLIAPHAFTDAPHSRGNVFIFRDYYEQFTETLQFINKHNFKNTLWIVRPHPTSIFLYGEGGIVKNYIKKLNNNMIKICPPYINTPNIIDICDVVVTGRGTIGLEAAISGKPTIIAGSASYSGLGLVIEHKSKKEYFTTLSNVKNISKLSKKKSLLAKRVLHYFDTKKIELKASKIVDDSIRTHLKNSELKKGGDTSLFCKQLVNNLSKTTFANDPLYKDLIRKL